MLTGLIVLVQLLSNFPTLYGGIAIPGAGRRMLFALLTGLFAFVASYVALDGLYSGKNQFLGLVAGALSVAAAWAFGSIYRWSSVRARELCMKRSQQLDVALEAFRLEQPARAAADRQIAPTEHAAVAAAASAAAPTLPSQGRARRTGMKTHVLTMLCGLAFAVAVLPPLIGLPVIWTGVTASKLVALAVGCSLAYALLVHLLRRLLGRGWASLANGLAVIGVMLGFGIAYLPPLDLAGSGTSLDRNLRESASALSDRQDVREFAAAFKANNCLIFLTALTSGDVSSVTRHCLQTPVGRGAKTTKPVRKTAL